MKRTVLLLASAVAVIGAVAYFAVASGHADEASAPIFLAEVPQGFRDWKLIAVSRLTKGDGTSQLRAQLGNDIAIKAYREGKLPFPDGAIIVRSNALLRYWEDVHYQYRLGLYDEVEYERQKAAWKASFANSVGFMHYWSEVRTLYSPRFASEIDGLQPPEPVKQPSPTHQ